MSGRDPVLNGQPGQPGPPDGPPGSLGRPARSSGRSAGLPGPPAGLSGPPAGPPGRLGRAARARPRAAWPLVTGRGGRAPPCRGDPAAAGWWPSAVLVLFGDGPDGPTCCCAAEPVPAPARRPARVPWRRDRRVRRRPGPRGAARGRRGGPGRPLGRAGAGRAAGAVHPAQRVLGHPGPGLVAASRPGGPGDPTEITSVARVPVADLADPAANRLTDPLSVRARRAGVPGRRHAGLGVHRDDRGPAARDRRLGAALGHRGRAGPPSGTCRPPPGAEPWPACPRYPRT